MPPSAERRLALLSAHQRSAPLEAREELALAAESAPASPDLLALLTCQRVELYCVVKADAEPRRWLAERLRLRSKGAVEAASLSRGADVVAHLLRVACGLDSIVRGEGQILGQIRRTYDAARASRQLDPLLADLFQSALHIARELRGATALGSVRRSVGSLAVDEAVRLVHDARAATALVIGAGEMGKLAARALRRRVGRLIVANRDPARAAAVAAEVGAEVVALERIEDALARVDVVIAAADTRGALLTAERLARRAASRPLPIVDIAVPRSVDAAGRAVPGVVYRGVDDLVPEADPALDGAIVEAERRCAAEVAAFMARQRAREAAGTIRTIRERADAVRREQLERALAKLGHLDERDRHVVEALASGLVNALLHAPTTALQRAPEKARDAEDLFDVAPPA